MCLCVLSSFRNHIPDKVGLRLSWNERIARMDAYGKIQVPENSELRCKGWLVASVYVREVI